MSVSVAMARLGAVSLRDWQNANGFNQTGFVSFPAVDTSTMKRMLKPMPSAESPVTSPEMGRRRYNYYNSATNTPHTHQHNIHNAHMLNNNGTMTRNTSQSSRFSGSRWVSKAN